MKENALEEMKYILSGMDIKQKNYESMLRVHSIVLEKNRHQSKQLEEDSANLLEYLRA